MGREIHPGQLRFSNRATPDTVSSHSHNTFASQYAGGILTRFFPGRSGTLRDGKKKCAGTLAVTGAWRELEKKQGSGHGINLIAQDLDNPSLKGQHEDPPAAVRADKRRRCGKTLFTHRLAVPIKNRHANPVSLGKVWPWRLLGRKPDTARRELQGACRREENKLLIRAHPLAPDLHPEDALRPTKMPRIIQPDFYRFFCGIFDANADIRSRLHRAHLRSAASTICGHQRRLQTRAGFQRRRWRMNRRLRGLLAYSGPQEKTGEASLAHQKFRNTPANSPTTGGRSLPHYAG